MKLSYEDTNNFSSFYVDKIRNLYVFDTKVSEELYDKIINVNTALADLYNLLEEEIEKPKREVQAKAEKERSLREDMRFEVSRREADLIESVLGQMSDGYWENNSSYDKFWKNISVDENTIVVRTAQLKYSSWSNTWQEQFKKSFTSVEGVKRFFAKKATAVLKADLKDNHNTTSIKGLENELANYLDSWRDKTVNQTYGEIAETINMLAA